MCIYMCIHAEKVSPKRPTMGLTLNGCGRLKDLKYCYNGTVWTIIWDTNKAIDIGKWSISGYDRLKRFYCIYVCVNRRGDTN